MSSAPSPRILFTIGHSNHSVPAFLSLLARHAVSTIADVRSQPYSRFNPHFNRERLRTTLQQAGMVYVFLGRELGARREEPEAYDGGRVCYDRVARLPAFQAGLERVRRGALSQRLALLCAEKDPLTCHRSVLVCRRLRADCFEIQHIRENGALESTAQLETRLLQAVELPPASLFRTRAELIEDAYELLGRRMGFERPAPPPPPAGSPV